MDERKTIFRSLQPRNSPARHASGRRATRVLSVVAFALALIPAFAQTGDARLQNGDFLNVWKIQDDQDDQDVPMHWFSSEKASVAEPWIRVLDGRENGVEITGGDTPRFLFQDVRIDPDQMWLLKWKVKGNGSASVSYYSRDDDENIYPGSSKITLLNEEFQDDELAIVAPPEGSTLRVTIGPADNSSTVVFESIELISAEDER